MVPRGWVSSPRPSALVTVSAGVEEWPGPVAGGRGTIAAAATAAMMLLRPEVIITLNCAGLQPAESISYSLFFERCLV